MNNYQYCAEFAVRLIGDNAGVAKVLDFGCGAGHIVELLRKAGIGLGCEAFYGGGAARFRRAVRIYSRNARRRDSIPACTFDVVINNQVMEHVEDIDAALSEIHRVLKPGGTFSVFSRQKRLA